MSVTKVIDRDKGYRRIMADLLAHKNATITVGLHGDNEPYDGSGATLAQVATFNEFGTEHIPARPFIRSTFDEQVGEWERLVALVERRLIAGTMSISQALKLLGAKIVADIQAKITDGPHEPNRPSTIAKKGSTSPLIDTGRLRQSVTFEIKR